MWWRRPRWQRVPPVSRFESGWMKWCRWTPPSATWSACGSSSTRKTRRSRAATPSACRNEVTTAGVPRLCLRRRATHCASWRDDGCGRTWRCPLQTTRRRCSSQTKRVAPACTLLPGGETSRRPSESSMQHVRPFANATRTPPQQRWRGKVPRATPLPPRCHSLSCLPRHPVPFPLPLPSRGVSTCEQPRHQLGQPPRRKRRPLKVNCAPLHAWKAARVPR